MKKLKLIIIPLILSMISCAKINSTFSNLAFTNEKGEYAIVFTNKATTKAAVNPVSSKGYDEFSLYTWNSNNEIIMNPYVVQAEDADTYTYEGIGSQTLQYFKNNADSYSFIGVIPTSDATLNNGSLTVGVESFVVDDKKAEGNGVKVDSPKEFLWARTDVNKVDYNKVVTLPFKHGNALLYLGFISDDANTEIIDYTPDIPGNSVSGTKTTEHAKMFDLLAQGKLVGYGLTKFQGDEHGEYRGFTGNYFNINPYLTGNSYITQERLAELMPLVNAQFIYTDENCNLVDKWEYGVDKKDKMFLKFADGVDATEFIAGNDAFWTNLTDTEKTALKNHHDSGCRIIRIERLDDGKYFAWGESYGLVVNTTDRDFKVINGGTIGYPATPSIPGIRVFSAKSDPTDGYAHLAHTNTADAIVSTGLAFDNRVTSSDVIQYSLPANTTIPVGTTEGDAVYSPTTFYSIPGDTGLTHFVVKISYIYKGVTVYDVRVPIELPTAGLESGKYYKYIINIKSTSNGTNNPVEAKDEKNDIDIIDNPILVTVDVTDYEEGDMKIITI